MKTYLANIFLSTGAEQAKMLVMVVFSVVLFIIIPFLRKSKPDEESSPKSDENKKDRGLNLNPNVKIRTDGYYLSKYEAITEFNEMVTIYFFIIFTRNGFVGLLEIEDYNEWKRNNTDEDIKELIVETNEIDEIKNPQILAKYQLIDGQIRMKFYDPDEYSNSDIENLLSYTEWYGSINKNGLVLSFDMSYFNDSLQDYVKENQIKNLKFQFKQIDLN